MSSPRLNYPRAHRLSTPPLFAAVYEAKTRDSRGPLVFYALPNTLGHYRLGLSVSRKVGVAPRRNRIKRLLRESYRHLRHDLPGGCGYDLVIVVRPHEPLALAEYEKLLMTAVSKLHATWQRRLAAKASPADAEGVL